MYIGPKLRTERPRKTKIGTEVATLHVTRTPLLKSKGQGYQAALLITVFTHQAAAAVAVGTYSPCEPTATLWSAGSVARGTSVPTEEREERDGAYHGGRPPTACFS